MHLYFYLCGDTNFAAKHLMDSKQYWQEHRFDYFFLNKQKRFLQTVIRNLNYDDLSRFKCLHRRKYKCNLP